MKLYKAMNLSNLEGWVNTEMEIPATMEFYDEPGKALQNRSVDDNIVLVVNHDPNYFTKSNGHFQTIRSAPLDTTIFDTVYSPGEAIKNHKSNLFYLPLN